MSLKSAVPFPASERAAPSSPQETAPRSRRGSLDARDEELIVRWLEELRRIRDETARMTR